MYILWSIQKRSVLLNLWCYRESLSFGISHSSLNYNYVILGKLLRPFNLHSFIYQMDIITSTCWVVKWSNYLYMVCVVPRRMSST